MNRIRWLLLGSLFALGWRAGATTPDPYITLHRRLLARLEATRTPAADSQRTRVLYELTRLYIEKADNYAGADGSFDSARYFNQRHLSLAYQLKWPLEEAEALTFRAKIAHMNNDFDESYQSALRALALFSRYPPGQCRNLYECLHRMGRIHFKTLEEYPAAVTYFERALTVAPSAEQRAFMLRQIGTCYSKLNRPAEAKRFYEQSLKLSKQPYDRAMCLNFLGELARTTGDTTGAIRLFNEALKADNQVMVQSAALNYLADTYWELRQPEAARRYAALALTPARAETNNLADRAEAYRLLYLTHKASGQTPQALRFHELYLATRDSLPSKEGLKKYYGLLISQQQQERREKEAAYQHEIAQQRQTRNLMLAIASLFLLLILTLWWTNRLQKRKNTQIERQAAEISDQNATILQVQRQLARANQQLRKANHALEDKVSERTTELLHANEELLRKNQEVEEALFKGQTLERKRVASELHDNLGGLLAAAQMSIKVLNPIHLSPRDRQVYENALQLISDAYKEVRLISHNLLPEELEKVGLAESLRRLVEKLNLNNNVLFDFDESGLDRRLDKHTEFHLYNICLELTNNILKHAEATQAILRFERQSKHLVLTVSDDGRGLTLGDNSDGMGLKNIRTRVESIGGTLRIDSPPEGGTRFAIRLPAGPKELKEPQVKSA